MKKFLLMFFVIAYFSVPAFSQTDGLLISENFPYTNGNLSGQGNSPAWASGGGTGDVIVTSLANNTGALVYPGYTSGTSYISINTGNSIDPYKGFIGSQSVSTSNATTFYMSFVVRVTNNSNTNAFFLAYPSLALRTSAGNNLCYFYIADDGPFGTQHLKFGISKTGGLGNGDYAPGNYSYNTTYLIVIRYDIVTGGSSNDKMYMWVNPSLVSEPAIGTAANSITSSSDGAVSGSVTGLQLLQDNSFFDGTTASFDAFKLSYATGFPSNPGNPIVAWTDLSPVGAPLPVKFGALKASQQSNGIRLDWSSYSEENADHYEIERSADGESFNTIGQLSANGNSNSKIDYTWTDEAPYSATNFYRIKSVDFDKKVMYSAIEKISIVNNSTTRMSLYPNPVTGSVVSVQLTNLQKGNYEIIVFDVMGQRLLKQQIIHNGGSATQTIQLPGSAKPGVYHVRLSDGTIRYEQGFIIK